MPNFYVAQPLGYSIQTSEIDNDAVTYAKIQNVSATDKILGRSTAGAGDVEEIACTSAGRALIDDAAASNQRTTLGLGNIALETAPLAVAKGGTALTALGTALQVLRTNAGATALEFATLSTGGDVVKMDSQQAESTATSEAEIFTKTFAANDFAANDLIIARVMFTQSAAQGANVKIRIADGTNTFTSTEIGGVGTTTTCQVAQWHISQANDANTHLICQRMSLHDATGNSYQTANDTGAEEATMIASWLASAITISIRGWAGAASTISYKYWLYKYKA